MTHSSATFPSASSASRLSFYAFIGVLLTVVGAAIWFIQRSEARDAIPRHATTSRLDVVLARGWRAKPDAPPHPGLLFIIREPFGARDDYDASMLVALDLNDGTAALIKSGDCTYPDNPGAVATTTPLGPACKYISVGPREVRIQIDIALPQDRTLEVTCKGPAHPASRRPDAACDAMLGSLDYN